MTPVTPVGTTDENLKKWFQSRLNGDLVGSPEFFVVTARASDNTNPQIHRFASRAEANDWINKRDNISRMWRFIGVAGTKGENGDTNGQIVDEKTNLRRPRPKMPTKNELVGNSSHIEAMNKAIALLNKI